MTILYSNIIIQRQLSAGYSSSSRGCYEGDPLLSLTDRAVTQAPIVPRRSRVSGFSSWSPSKTPESSPPSLSHGPKSGSDRFKAVAETPMFCLFITCVALEPVTSPLKTESTPTIENLDKFPV